MSTFMKIQKRASWNHVSVFESRRGDEVAHDEGHISSQFRLEDSAEDRRLTFSAQRGRIKDSVKRDYKIHRPQEAQSAFRRTAKIK